MYDNDYDGLRENVNITFFGSNSASLSSTTELDDFIK
jgi:hypothetical protein